MFPRLIKPMSIYHIRMMLNCTEIREPGIEGVVYSRSHLEDQKRMMTDGCMIFAGLHEHFLKFSSLL